MRPCRCFRTRAGNFHFDDVRLYTRRIDERGIEAVQALREALRGAVVLTEAVDHDFERDNTRRGERTRLAHVAADLPAKCSRALDEDARAAQQRADGRRKAFGHAKAYGIAVSRNLRN